jgi:deoxyadenosine/deoxycytidine kinase
MYLLPADWPYAILRSKFTRTLEQKTMAKPYVVVVGNVCAGKSTFLKHFAARYGDWRCLLENSLENVWLKPQQVLAAFPTSVYFMGYHARYHLEASRCAGPLIQETCLEQSGLFPAAYYELGYFSLGEMQTLQLNYSVFSACLPTPDFYIYLRAPLETLLARADEREEPTRSLSLKLIPVMQNRLETWLAGLSPARVVTLDTSQTPADEYPDMLEQIHARLRAG